MVLIVGTPDADFLKGTNADDILQGLAENDVLLGDGGQDTLAGGPGDDALYGMLGDDVFLFGTGDGSDQIYGGPGFDKILATADNVIIEIGRLEEVEEISINGHSGVQLVIGSYSNWVDLRTVTLNGFSKIYTSGYGSQLVGTLFSDQIFGGSGSDLVAGGGGYDEIHGGGGNDRLMVATGKYFGDDGADEFLYVSSDKEVAILTGGNDVDTYELRISTQQLPDGDFLALSGVADIVTDFKVGTGGDRINLPMMGYSNFLIGWDRSTNPFVAGYFRLQQVGSDTVFQIDRTGTGASYADVLRLENRQASALTIDNFADGFSPNGVGTTLNGTTRGDTLNGTEFADIINGLGGNDAVDGRGGDDVIHGDAGADNLFGGLGKDHLFGGVGDDVLEGGAGSDILDGGAGNDSLYVDNSTDIVIEGLNEGTDTIYASATYTLSANVERLVLLGPNSINGAGNELGNTLSGNGSDNQLFGFSGNDTLDGKGGNDSLVGGTGNDSYIIEERGDSVLEFSDEGTDTVIASIGYTLAANVENLTLVGDAFVDGTGNDLSNILSGNSGVNHLYGLAGDDTLDGKADADTLAGGIGNDTYVIDNWSDIIVEYAGEGIDTVKAYLSYTLLDSNLENITLLGASAINGSGNASANFLKGNAAANQLYGLGGNDKLNGGLGADIMVGGIGNDNYTVDNVGDVVTENLNEGSDSVSASISYTLQSNVEKLTLTGSAGLSATGNDLGNSLVGNSGSNLLSGLAGKDMLSGGLGNDILSGGLGADTLTGGSGNDQFVFDVLETSINKDTIKDFEHGVDAIVLNRSAFLGFFSSGAGPLSASAFFAGSSATMAAQHIIYDQAAGTLFYDADGIGGQAQVQIALLASRPALDAADFILI